MIVLDTDVLSELTRREPDTRVVAWLDSLPVSEVATTAITAAELLYGVSRLPEGHPKAALAGTIHVLLAEDFRERVKPFSEHAAAEYASVVTARERLGRPIATADTQIAAICRSHRATLATRNTKDFEDTGINLVNPWLT